MKSARKCLALVTVPYLFGGVLDSRVPGARGDWELLGASRTPRQSDALFLRAQGQVPKQDPEPAGSKSSSGVSQAKSRGIREPPFLKHAFVFDPDSAELSVESRNALKRAASWLREPPGARILFVGFCDSSDTCTSAVAERRGAVVRQCLVWLGTAPDQIAAVKGWSNLDREGRTDTAKCQQVNRSAVN
jgi:outer membrane protein OmpA-like peptidoglycan-associated protein